MKKINHNRKNQLLTLLILLIMTAGFSFAGAVAAQVDAGLAEVGAVTGFFQQDPRLILAKLVRIALGFIGVVATGLVMYGGFLWMTSRGNAEQVERARKVLINAGVGLLIIIGSYSFVSFLISRISGRGGATGPTVAEQYGGYLGGALGGGVVESHYPARNAVGVARNTKIIVTFKEEMSLESIVNDNETPEDLTDDTLLIDNVVIKRTSDAENPSIAGLAARVGYTDDHRTFVFTPTELLGSATEPTSYSVLLTNNIRKAKGTSAFGNFGSYGWRFEVSTVIDVTPPRLTGVFPKADKTTPRNTIIQMNFDEAMDPLSVTGTSPLFINLEVRDETDRLVAGTFRISNQYRTVEFRTDDLCGQNACGGDVYCLPGGVELTTLIKAASLEEVGAPTALFPYDGAADVAGNSFDGDENGVADGPTGDHFSWSFNVSNFIDLTPPVIEDVEPNPYSSGVPVDALVGAMFSKVMQMSTLNTTNVIFEAWPYWLESVLVEPEEGESTVDRTGLIINHEDLEIESEYRPGVTSGVTDIYQNCFQPCTGPLP